MLSFTLAGAAAFGALDALAVLNGGPLLLAGNLVALWLSVGFLAGRRARQSHGAMLLGLAAEAVAILGFYLVNLAAAVVTGPIAGWLGYSSVHGCRALALFALAGLWAAEPRGWIGLERMRTGQVSVGTGELALAGGELLVALLIGLAGLIVLLDERGRSASAADPGLHH